VGLAKFLIGESLRHHARGGVVRLPGEPFGLYFNGIALVSSVLDFSTISFNAGNDLPFVMYLPTETAVAWFHKKLPADLQSDRKKALKESEQFALAITNRALMQGSALSASERKHIVKELRALTGLSEDYVDRANLRIYAHRFFCGVCCRKEASSSGATTRGGQDRTRRHQRFPGVRPQFHLGAGAFHSHLERLRPARTQISRAICRTKY